MRLSDHGVLLDRLRRRIPRNRDAGQVRNADRIIEIDRREAAGHWNREIELLTRHQIGIAHALASPADDAARDRQVRGGHAQFCRGKAK
jgi:hypothetical protein